MNITCDVEVNINVPRLVKIVHSDKLGNFASHEWHRLISPYTPHLTGNLERNVEYQPWEFTYISPYARPQYNGVSKKGKAFKYSKEHNSKATREWDSAAKREKKDNALADAIQGYIDSGNLNLND